MELSEIDWATLPTKKFIRGGKPIDVTDARKTVLLGDKREAQIIVQSRRDAICEWDQSINWGRLPRCGDFITKIVFPEPRKNIILQNAGNTIGEWVSAKTIKFLNPIPIPDYCTLEISYDGRLPDHNYTITTLTFHDKDEFQQSTYVFSLQGNWFVFDCGSIIPVRPPARKTV